MNRRKYQVIVAGWLLVAVAFAVELINLAVAPTHGIKAVITLAVMVIFVASSAIALRSRELYMEGHYSFTQPACAACFAKKYPGRVPGKLIETEIETCCLCGEPTGSGIYIRVEPDTVPHPTRMRVPETPPG